MQYTKTDNTYVLKLERGERVIETLTGWCAEVGINNATLSAIGAVEQVSCGYYELANKTYHFTTYPELVEVVSLTGNVMLKEGSPFLHVHAVFTDTNNQAFGGHVEEMTVGVVLEVIVTQLDTSIERLHDEQIGLFLMNCGD